MSAASIRGRPVAVGPGIGEPALRASCGRIRPEPVDGDHVAAEIDVALGAEGAGGGRRASTRSVNQATNARGSRASILARPAKAMPCGVTLRRPLSRIWAAPGARKSRLSTSQVPASASVVHIAADALQHGASERDILDADAELDRDRQPLRAGEVIGEGLDSGSGPVGASPPATPACGRGRAGSTTGRRPIAASGRTSTGIALELDRPIVGPVLEFDLLQHRRTAVAFDPAGDAPRLDDQPSPRRRASDRTRQLQRAFEARDAAARSRRSSTSAISGRSIGSRSSRTRTAPSRRRGWPRPDRDSAGPQHEAPSP